MQIYAGAAGAQKAFTFGSDGSFSAVGAVWATSSFIGSPGDQNFGLFRYQTYNVLQFSPNWSLQWDSGDGSLRWYSYAAGTYGATFTPAGGLSVIQNLYGANVTVGANGYKPGGGAWADSSDIRTKQDIEPYTAGLYEVLQLEPKRYSKNGKGGTKATDTRYIGLIAQDVQPVMPEMVFLVPDEMQPAVDDQDYIPELLGIETTALIYALVNSVQTLTQRIVALEGGTNARSR